MGSALKTLSLCEDRYFSYPLQIWVLLLYMVLLLYPFFFVPQNSRTNRAPIINSVPTGLARHSFDTVSPSTCSHHYNWFLAGSMTRSYPLRAKPLMFTSLMFYIFESYLIASHHCLPRFSVSKLPHRISSPHHSSASPISGLVAPPLLFRLNPAIASLFAPL